MAAGWNFDEATQRYAAIDTYTFGFCALEAARHRDGNDPASTLASDSTGLVDAIPGFVSEQLFWLGLRAPRGVVHLEIIGSDSPLKHSAG